MNHDPHAQSPHASRLRIDFAQASDPGRDPNKQVNEDSCGYAETRFGHLAVLCDGMGGHYGGKEASRTAITTIFEIFEQLPSGTPGAQALKAAIEEAGRRVYQLGGPPDNRARPGSTVVAMLLGDRGLDVAHVGDSRAYIIRSNQIYPLTRDHSMVQGMIDAGMLTEETAMGHPDSNKITRALGMRPDVDVELRPETMEVFPGDLLLQSSDGLTDLALGREILGCARQALASGGVENACNMLVRMANDRGGHDNITVQIVRVVEVGPKVRTTIPERPVAMGHPQGVPQTPPGVAMGHPQGVPQTPPGVAMGHPQGPPGASSGHAGGGGPAYVTTAYPGQAASTAPPLTPEPTAAMPAFGASPAWSSAPTLQGMPPHPGFAATPTPAPVSARPTLSDPAPADPRGVPVTAPGGAGPTAAWGATAFVPMGNPHRPPGVGMGNAVAMANPEGPPGGAGSAQALQAGGASPQPTPTPYGMYTPGAPVAGSYPQQQGFPGYGPLAAPAVPVSRGGIVFVILGLSGVIAVLILVIVWALWLRS